MAKVLCGISGVEFSVEHLSISLHSREYAHPVFYLPQKKLLGLYSKYQQGEMNSIDSYLTFLAYLNSTDLVEWRVPAKRTPMTDSIIAQNFENLVLACEKIVAIKSSSSEFCHISISPDTQNLSAIPYWIASWENTWDDFTSGYAADKKKQDLAKIEERVDRILYSSEQDSDVQLATKLAEWADKAASFPRFAITFGSSTIPCNEYWKGIIRKCTRSESIFSIPSADLTELITHCEDNLDVGSTYSYHLLKILREGQQKQAGFLGLGDFTFSILPQDSSVEDANRAAIVANAPTEEPQRIAYPSQFQYLKAKLAYDMSQNSQPKIAE